MQQRCIDSGWDGLASVHDNTEWQAILSSRPDSNGAYLLGGTDQGSEGVWRWMDGTAWSFSMWAPGEPSGSTSENYLNVFGNQEAAIRRNLWNDTNTSLRSQWICGSR
jgi:hypothetical protein